MRKTMTIEENTKLFRQKGFSLIECMFALVITVVGLTAVAGLVVEGIHLSKFAEDTALADTHAKRKIEELQNYASTSPERTRGGDLAADVAGYNELPNPKIRLRWLIEEHPTDTGVPAGTQRITVAVVPGRAGVRLPDVRIEVLVPQ